MTVWRAYLFPTACAVVAVGAVLYGADAWLHLTATAMAALCWVTRHHKYDGVIRLMCAAGLSGGTFALAISAVLSAAAGTVEAAALSFGCSALSGMAASTQMCPAGRFISEAAGLVRGRTT